MAVPIEWSSVGQYDVHNVRRERGLNLTVEVYQPLERHPFSGRCDSAGELLHTPYADSNFHGHRPAVCTTRNTLSRLSEGWSGFGLARLILRTPG